MRRAQPTVFESQSSINACPKLRMHASPVSAACVPVSVNGHLLGVLHATDADGYPPANNVVEQMVTLAGQLGGRIGAMRTLESTRLQATTDGLTGLANRRMLEAQVAELILSDTPFVLVVADLDRFKTLNDNYGHEFGDRALQLFARVLEANLRGKDIVARYGGEEFVMVLPEMSVAPSMEVVERIRQALARSVESSGLPSITSSFGLTHSTVGDSVESIIRIADAGLMMAKDLGRNRVVFADADLAAEVFTDERERGVLVHAVDVDDTRDARTEAPPVPAETPVVIESTSSADQR
jgi:diguanylate cyclase (GGDEF)-like protein